MLFISRTGIILNLINSYVLPLIFPISHFLGQDILSMTQWSIFLIQIPYWYLISYISLFVYDKSKNKKKELHKGAVFPLAAIAIISVLFFWPGVYAPQSPEFTHCLEQHDITIYYNPQCPYCQQEREILMPYRNQITWVNCVQNPTGCESIDAVPAFVWDTETTPVYGRKSIDEIMAMIMCSGYT